jgi:hypothetical protein
MLQMHDQVTSPMTSSFSAHTGADAASEHIILQLLLESVATQVVISSLLSFGSLFMCFFRLSSQLGF